MVETDLKVLPEEDDRYTLSTALAFFYPQLDSVSSLYRARS